MAKLSLYTIFHLNLGYSAIAEEQLSEVIRRCYWPLLRLAEEFPRALAIEAGGYTLTKAKELDPAWVSKLRALVTAGICDFLGSGYIQLAGPLVPMEVNRANLRWGQVIYEKLLGFRPQLAYINELAYSGGLLPLYREAGYRAVLMEWNNTAAAHPAWSPELQYAPQFLRGADGEILPVIWINSKAFQYFQRFVHQEEDLATYLTYLRGHIGQSQRFLSIYGSDTEVFDFRPRRHATEAPLIDFKEWKRIHDLFVTLARDERLALVTPRQVLEVLSPTKENQALSLETVAQPIIVKKQDEYNITRWALTGRDSFSINTSCYQYYQDLISRQATEEEWRELCYLWSSDFRTHIEEKRFIALQRRLASITAKLRQSTSPNNPEIASGPVRSSTISFKQEGAYLIVETAELTVSLDVRRGLAIQSFTFPKAGSASLFGRLPLGFYGDAILDSDFNSGHTTIEIPGKARLKDLKSVRPTVRQESPVILRISALIVLPVGTIRKDITIDAKNHSVTLDYTFDFEDVLPASVRTGIISINPRAFALPTLSYSCANGGQRETFKLAEAGMISTEPPLSLLVSARGALGNTDGRLEITDGRIKLQLEVDSAMGAALPFLHFQPLPSAATYLLRIFFSLAEIDDTNRSLPGGRPLKAHFRLRLKPAF